MRTSIRNLISLLHTPFSMDYISFDHTYWCTVSPASKLRLYDISHRGGRLTTLITSTSDILIARVELE